MYKYCKNNSPFLFAEELIIWEPQEFRNKSFMAHLNEMPWAEQLLTEQIEKSLYRGMHMTFCKLKDDTWGVVSLETIFLL